MIQVLENCLQLRGRLVHHYALLPETPDEGGITLIDGGFLSSTPERWLPEFARLGYGPGSIEAILVTHGHIDHTLNLARWKELTGSKIFAPAADRLLVEGHYPYTGLSRACGWMETAARKCFSYRVPEIDTWLAGGESLPFWGGLTVVPLPGHTPGHVGFFSASKRILFAGDLFSSFRRKAKMPPPWLNVDSGEIRRSIRHAASLDSSGGVLLSHCHPGTAEEYRGELQELASRC